MPSRYIVRQDRVADLLSAYPEISILRMNGPDQAVVLMDEETAERLREENPDLRIEPDVRHRPASP